jgi:hypothetical protein
MTLELSHRLCIIWKDSTMNIRCNSSKNRWEVDFPGVLGIMGVAEEEEGK